MKLVLFALSLGLVASAHADIGNGKILSCGSKHENFTLFRTAAPNLFQGNLNDGVGETIVLTCKNTKKRTGSLEKVMTCIENRVGDGKIKVVIESGGAVGIQVAQVYQAQEYPLEPAQIASLPCLK